MQPSVPPSVLVVFDAIASAKDSRSSGRRGPSKGNKSIGLLGKVLNIGVRRQPQGSRFITQRQSLAAAAHRSANGHEKARVPARRQGEDGWLKIRVLLADLLRLALRLVLPVICESDNPPNGTVPWRNCTGGSPRRAFPRILRPAFAHYARPKVSRAGRHPAFGAAQRQGDSTPAMGPRSWLRGNWCSNYFGAGRRARLQSAGSPPQGLHKQLWSESSWAASSSSSSCLHWETGLEDMGGGAGGGGADLTGRGASCAVAAGFAEAGTAGAGFAVTGSAGVWDSGS